jgi:hypothetical protein
VAAKAPPGGYTLLLGGIGPQALSVALYPKLPYDPERDLAPISLVAAQPNLLVVKPALPVASLANLIRYAKANPGKLSVGSAGNGSGQHFGLEQLKQDAGTSSSCPCRRCARASCARSPSRAGTPKKILQRLPTRSRRCRRPTTAAAPRRWV